MSRVYLALGSNLGDRLANLQLAVAELEKHGVVVEAKSKIYRSDSVGSGGEGEFLNAILRVRTLLSPLELLALCQGIEALAGRSRPDFAGAKREGERELDIDILMCGEEVSSTPELQLPHPRALERSFVLRPLLDLLDSGGVVATELSW